jgi:hypothetical protein
MTLAETQALFHEAITAAAPLGPERLRSCFAGSAGLPAEDRVAIYAGMYLARLMDALRQTFPALARLLGDQALGALAGDYLRRHPSRHHDIGQVGRRLPAFLRRHPDPERPDLADLAALEWARQATFFAPDRPAAGPELFAGLAPGDFAGAALRFHPALRRLALLHDAAPLWRSLQDGVAPGPPAAGPVTMAVWRRGFEVVHATLADDEAEALRRAAAGAPLAEVCAAFAEASDPAAAAHRALASWLAEGWITGLRRRR